jgi:hypothetical protein
MDIVQLLVKLKAQVDLPSKNGLANALSMAASFGRPEIIKFLLQNGASAVPPQKVKKWKRLKFKDSVDTDCKEEVLRLLHEAYNEVAPVSI